MNALDPELLVTVATVIVYGVLALSMIAVGLVLEVIGLQYVATGDVVLGVWMAAIGAIALYGGSVGIAWERLLGLVLTRE